MQEAIKKPSLAVYPFDPFYSNKTVTIVLLYIFTLGLYEHYWHYRNWKIIRENSGDLSISPILRGLFFPFFIFSFISVLKGSAELSKISIGVARSSFAFVYTLVALLKNSFSNEADLVVFIFSVLPLYFLQVKINEIIFCMSGERSRPKTISERLKNTVTFNKENIPLGGAHKKIMQHKGYEIPNRYTIEFSVFVLVFVIGTYLALRDSEHAIAKAKLTEVFSFVSAMKVEMSEIYALRGTWPEKQQFDYLSGSNGTELIKKAFSTEDGSFHFELRDESPFNNGNILSFPLKSINDDSPYKINNWTCNAQDIANYGTNLTTVERRFLPSICRGK